jgi:iron complex transport system substrate-binding protein
MTEVHSIGRPEFPRRIICLTEETTETLYLLEEGHRVVGVSGYIVRPPAARLKPKVSAFINARIEKILTLEPDLVLAFSDLQADIARELIRKGLNVFTFNQRSVDSILKMIETLARLVGVPERGKALVNQLEHGLQAIAISARRFPQRPRVFFEEWKDPLISGIRWVEELIEIAGGSPVFPELRLRALAKDRIILPSQVIEPDPEVIIASWCGVKVSKSYIRSRTGWSQISAVRNQHVYEIKSTYILQPGPAALSEGVRQLHAILAHVTGVEIDSQLAPQERVDPDLAPRNGLLNGEN